MLAYALPSDAQVLHACVNDSSGAIKIVAEAAVCPTGSSKTSLVTTAPLAPLTDVYVSAPPDDLTMPHIGFHTLAELDLPSGQYLVFGYIGAVFPEFGAINRIDCHIAGTDKIAISASYDYNNDNLVENVSLGGAATFPSAQKVTFKCQGLTSSAAEITLAGVKLIAHAVGTIHDQSPPP